MKTLLRLFPLLVLAAVAVADDVTPFKPIPFAGCRQATADLGRSGKGTAEIEVKLVSFAEGAPDAQRRSHKMRHVATRRAVGLYESQRLLRYSSRPGASPDIADDGRSATWTMEGKASALVNFDMHQGEPTEPSLLVYTETYPKGKSAEALLADALFVPVFTDIPRWLANHGSLDEATIGNFEAYTAEGVAPRRKAAIYSVNLRRFNTEGKLVNYVSEVSLDPKREILTYVDVTCANGFGVGVDMSGNFRLDEARQAMLRRFVNQIAQAKP